MKRFYESFGIRLSPWSPLSSVSDDNRVMHTLKGSGGSDLVSREVRDDCRL